MHNYTPTHDTFIQQYSSKPGLAAHCGSTIQSRKSPVLSRRELQQVILEILG